jgi:hypothetical protein
MDDVMFVALLSGILLLFVLGGLWADSHLDSPAHRDARRRNMARKVRP